MATDTHTWTHRARRCAFLAAAATALAVAAPAHATYGWPVKPFFRQHPVRGFLGDPRIGRDGPGLPITRSIHFGIDVSAPDGTPVYATQSGTVVANALHPDVLEIHGPGGIFEYWHIVPAVAPGTHAVAYTTVLGRIGKGWGHVHFSERRVGTYVNPLRPGALSPYRDTTKPQVHAIGFERDGAGLGRVDLAGRLDLVVEATDETPVPVPAPWHDRPVTPAVIRWRLVGSHARTSPWQTAVDVGATLPRAAFDGVYAPWTRQNRPYRNGRYRFYLQRGWNSAAVANGRYRIEVVVADTRGNRSRASATFTVRNPALPS